MIHKSRRAPFNAENDPMWQTAEILEVLISPAPVQFLVAPPTQLGQATLLIGNLATAPTQAKPRHEPARAEESAALTTPYRSQLEVDPHSRIRHGLAGYFSGGIGEKGTQPQADQKNAIFLFRRFPNIQPSPRTTTTSSPANRLLPRAAREAAERWMPRAGANAHCQKRKMVQVKTDSSMPDRSRDPRYIKVQSKGQIGYLPKSNLQKAKKRDKTLKVLGW